LAHQNVGLGARANHQRPNLPAHLERVADLGRAERRGAVVWPEQVWIVGHDVALEPRYVVIE